MQNIRFEKYARRDDCEPLYRMLLDGTPVRSGLTLDEVITAINRHDEESLGARHSPGREEVQNENR